VPADAVEFEVGEGPEKRSGEESEGMSGDIDKDMQTPGKKGEEEFLQDEPKR